VNKICRHCRHVIVQRESGLWTAFAYADINGYCLESPTDLHEPG
jgi:hypothetical protein